MGCSLHLGSLDGFRVHEKTENALASFPVPSNTCPVAQTSKSYVLIVMRQIECQIQNQMRNNIDVVGQTSHCQGGVHWKQYDSMSFLCSACF